MYDDKLILTIIKHYFGNVSVAKDRDDVSVVCPDIKCSSHRRSKRKLSINLKSGASHCWVCGSHFHLRILLKMYFGVNASLELKDVEKVSQNSCSFFSRESQAIEENLTLPHDFFLLCNNVNSIDPDVKACLNYLRFRGLRERDLWYFKFGMSFLKKFRRRVMMPSFNELGELNYYIARSIDGKKPKYINSNNEKTNIIFNELNLSWNRILTLVEGPFDLVKCDDNSTCILGSELSEKSALFKKIVYHKTPILLAFDSDASHKMRKVGELLSKYGISLKIIDLGHRKDVGEMTKEQFLSSKNHAKCWDMWEDRFKFDLKRRLLP